MSEKEPNGKRPPRKRIPSEQKDTSRRPPSIGRSQGSKPGAGKKSYGSRDNDAPRERKPYASRDNDAPRERKPYASRDNDAPRERKPYASRDNDAPRERKPFASRDNDAPRERKPYGNQDNDAPRERKPFGSRDNEAPRERKPFGSRDNDTPRESKPFGSRDNDTPRERKPFGSRDNDAPRERKPFGSRDNDAPRERKPFGSRDNDAPRERKPFGSRDNDAPRERKSYGRRDSNDPREHKPARLSRFEQKEQIPGRMPEKKDFIRLNKYLADAGICSRREADVLIQAGTVTVNGTIVTELGTKVSINDKVNYGGQTLRREKLRYVLLNKPKGYITTSDDPFDRKTVMELVQSACDERIYPVGRLDRNTLGLLILTNDGDLAKRLMHPRHGVKKLYHVELDKPITKHDMLLIADGLELEDGKAEIDAISYVSKDESKKEVGIEIHSGKNRIVRRIFEQLGYNVVKLDRVMIAGLTKLDLPRGKYRHLTPSEVSLLMRIK